jgi:GNAT superfamily N-acetyltransferase
MKREVIQWYNALRESWGLELIGEEPEDIEDIAQEDFRFREGRAADSEAAKNLHQACIENAAPPVELAPWIFPGDICVVAESAGGDFAAYICASATNGGYHIAALEVKPEYRGLGLGKALLNRLLEQAGSGNISGISIDLPAEFENFARVLSRAGFRPVVTRYYRKTDCKEKIH